LAATGSLEASAARHAAFVAYQTYHTRNKTDAIRHAQEIERESFPQLSIQQLLDCDVSTDQGCTGGNPLLAFYFLHRYGVTSATNYPYVGIQQDACKKDWMHDDVVAAVESWGVLSPNHERAMQVALRYIGPIAVGVHSADASFRAYRSGIFDQPHCKQGGNHALLITGYGEERLDNGTVVQYWIARNSWGTDWGEDGYVRIKRGDGKKGTPGVCGIARNPSVALGGYLVKGDVPLPDLLGPEGPLQDVCRRLGLSNRSWCVLTTTWIDSYQAWTLGAIGMIMTVLILWVLSGDWRRRRRRRKLRLQKRESESRLMQLEQERSVNGCSSKETDSLLLALSNVQTAYGANF
jgi:hypothetical protein